jgi:hypothetical protein
LVALYGGIQAPSSKSAYVIARGFQSTFVETYGLVASGHALTCAVLVTIATTMIANTRASLSQGAYGCMRAKSSFTMSPPFFLTSQVLWFTLLVNNKGAGITKLLPRIIVDKVGGDFFTKGM